MSTVDVPLIKSPIRFPAPVSCTVVKWPCGTSNRSPLLEKLHSNSASGGSALIRHGMETDSSSDAPTIVTLAAAHTGESVKERQLNYKPEMYILFYFAHEHIGPNDNSIAFLATITTTVRRAALPESKFNSPRLELESMCRKMRVILETKRVSAVYFCHS